MTLPGKGDAIDKRGKDQTPHPPAKIKTPTSFQKRGPLFNLAKTCSPAPLHMQCRSQPHARLRNDNECFLDAITARNVL